MTDDREWLRTYAQATVDGGLGMLERFAEDLMKNPPYAMEWSLKAFRAAAQVGVGSTLLRLIDGGAKTEDIVKHLENTVIHSARYPSRSTSPPANLMHEEILSMNAEIISDLKMLLEENS